MRDDNLATVDVVKALKNFEIIEEYHGSKPFPSCLLLCWPKGEPLHVVCALPKRVDMLIIVTVYIPCREEWLDYRRRGRRRRK
jgi:hypothetical protein